MILTQIIIWFCSVALVYTYFIYPLLVKILSASKKNNPIVFTRGEYLPTVSVLIPAYNEEAVIQEKIESVFSSNYPIENVEVLIGSDASTDATNEIILKCEKKFPHLRLIVFTQRSGKPSVVNHLVSLAKNDILLLTDANVMLNQEAMFEMLKHFKNAEIALVDSNMQHKGLKKEGISRQEKTYIKGEVNIKNAEGKIWGNMMGPFGGCYAIRKEYYSEIPSNLLVDDFYINMKIFEKGGKAINEPLAVVYEDVSSILKEEFRRKIRIATGNFQNLSNFYPLLFKLNAVSFSFFSHKALRWKGPFFIIFALISNLLLVFYFQNLPVQMHLFYTTTLVVQIIIFLMPIIDFILNKINLHPLIPRLVSHFLSMNVALLIGFFRFLKGVNSGIWTPTQRNQFK